MNPPLAAPAHATAPPDRPAVQRYGFALLMLIAGLLGRHLLEPYTTDAVPLVTLYTAVAFTVWFGGWRPAALLVVVGYVAGLWWFLPPRYSFKLWTEFGVFRTFIYFFSCATTIFLCEAMRRAQRRHARSEATVVSILDSTHDGFCSLDDQWRITCVNRSAESRLGVTRAAVLGRPLWDVLPNLKGSNAESELRRAAQHKTSVQVETDAFVPRAWAALNITPAGSGLAIFFEDITAQKTQVQQLEQVVAERTAALRDTVANLEAFSYTLVHDMRAPLRSISAFAAILTADHAAQLDSAGRHHLRRIEKAARRMDQLIVDLLDYSRAARGHAEVRPVDLEDLVREILRSYPDFQPEQADIAVEGSLPVVRGNVALLTQCFSNLLHNATKFVAPGVKPVVRIRATTTDDVARIQLADNGIGIAPEAWERIFEPFHRENSVYEGTGIGLAIVKKVIAQLGGRVGVESELGEGSRFWLELKLASADEAIALRRESESLEV